MLDNPYSGANSVGEYQLSGVPWAVTGQIQNIAKSTSVDDTDEDARTVWVIQFPTVTRWIWIKNLESSTDGSGDINLFLSGLSCADHQDSKSVQFFTLKDGQVAPGGIRLEMRVDKLYFSEADKALSLSIMAGCTSVAGLDIRNMVEEFVDGNKPVL